MDTNQTVNTGTRNVTYDLTAVLYHALQGVENCQIYAGDAQGKAEHRQFFQQAMQAQKQLAEQAKTLLHDCLMQEINAGSSDGSAHRQGNTGGMESEISSTQTHSFEQARDDGSAFRFASGQTQGGSDQFEGTEGERQDQATTGGGGGSRF